MNNQEEVLKILTELGVQIDDIESVDENKIVESAKEAKRLYEANDHEGFLKLLSNERFKDWSNDEVKILRCVWLNENTPIDDALDDAMTALGLWKSVHVLTESGILLLNGETLAEGRVVEFARELSNLWHAKEYQKFMCIWRLI